MRAHRHTHTVASGEFHRITRPPAVETMFFFLMITLLAEWMHITSNVLVLEPHMFLFLFFLQLNPDVNVFQRKFVNEVRRCEEMDRKLSKRAARSTRTTRRRRRLHPGRLLFNLFVLTFSQDLWRKRSRRRTSQWSTLERTLKSLSQGT